MISQTWIPFRAMPVRRFALSLFAGLIGLVHGYLPAQEFKILHNFDQGTEGIRNSSPLIQGVDGRLYGTSTAGGKYDNGTVFAANTDGSGFTVLHHFNRSAGDGGSPYGGVIQANDGRLYGTTSNGSDSIFGLNPDGTGFTVLHVFVDGSGTVIQNAGGYHPYAGLIQGSDGRLYGATSAGAANNAGAIFALNLNGSGFTILRNLNQNTDGSVPRGCLLQGTNGRLYGTASAGGANGVGTIFTLNSNGSDFAVLRHLTAAADGSKPYAGLVQGNDGRLYGVNREGGANGNGTLFALNQALNAASANYSVLFNFQNGTNGGNGFWPQGKLIQGTDGRLYGTTYFQSWGKIFAFSPSTNAYTVLRTLNDAAEGAYLNAGLLQANDGRLYGTAEGGGTYNGGTIFGLDTNGSNFAVLRHSDYRSLGETPRGRLLEGTDGKLYGTTVSGGAIYQAGNMFSIDKDGSNFAVLRDFRLDLFGVRQPTSGLVLSDDGHYYGTSGGGTYGRGAIYRINQDGTNPSVVHGFGLHPDGQTVLSSGELVKGTDGRLYGMTSDTAARIFAINANGGGYTILHTLASNGLEGSAAAYNDMHSGLVAGSDGRLYGVTPSGGANGGGTIFSMNTDGTNFTVLRHFTPATDGYFSYGSLIEASDGRLYGTNAQGLGFAGSIFGINKNGTGFAVLRTFIGGLNSVAASPQSGVVEGPGGRLYGATAAGGTFSAGVIYSINRDSSDFKIVHNFHPTTDGRGNGIRLMRASNGDIFGAAPSGGPFVSAGMLFSVGFPPVITSPLTATGTYAQPFSYTIAATNQPDDFDALGLPASLVVNHGNGEISGVPTQTGAFPVVIAATNAFGTDFADLALTIAKAPTTVTLGNLLQTYDGAPKPVTVTTDPAGLNYSVTYDGTATVPSSVGSHAVTATVQSDNYAGDTHGTLVIVPGPAETVIDRTVVLASDQISTASDGTNTGKRWRVQIPITPVTLNNGDTIRGTVQFAALDSLRLSDQGGGFFLIGTTTGFEQVQMEFLNSGPNILSGSSRQFTFQSVTGPLLMNPLSRTGNTFFNGSFAQFAENLVNPGESFSFRSFSYVQTLTSGGPMTVSSISFQFLAEDVSIESAPPPVITSALSTGGTIGSGFGYTITATNTPTSFSATGLPPDLAVHPTTGVISGTPTTSGIFSVTLAATNLGGTGTATLDLTILPRDVTAQLQITRSGFRYNRITKRYAQTLTIQNNGSLPITGPVSLVFAGLSPNATLVSPTGVTTLAPPPDSSFINLNAGPDNALTAGESIILIVEFTNSTNQAITYTSKAFAGPGAR